MKRPVSLTPEELIRLLAVARERRLRDWVMILLAYVFGMRASEIVGLRVRDVQDGLVIVRRGKGSEATCHAQESHENPLLDVREAIGLWLTEMGARGPKGGRRRNSKMQPSSRNVAFPQNQLLFPVSRQQFWRIVRAHAIDAGIPAGLPYRNKRKAHALKHSIARHLTQDGMPPRDLMEYLGWKKLETAAIYTLPDADEVGARATKILREKAAFRSGPVPSGDDTN
jgi:integrase/recombinase XerD